ncbi:PUA domain-containing protein, partial [Nocardioides sp. NPDC000441]
GSITVDAGAVAAISRRGASLLAAGVTGSSGAFHAGDPVDVVDPSGVAVARGLVNYDADEIPRLAGRSSGYLEANLGAAYAREVIHRDDLVVL